MVSDFVIKIVLSFVVAGSWIAIATLLAERLGSKIGGLFANLPSNMLVSFLFIGWTQGIGSVVEASKAGPIGMMIDSVFLFVLVVMLKRGIKTALAAALATWFGMALVAGFLKFDNIMIGAIVYAIVTVAAFYLLEYRMKIPAQQKSKKRYSPAQILMRALFGGGVVSSAVFIASISGPFWGGLFACFPAVLMSSIVILTILQGREFAQATGKVLMLSSSNIVVFALGVYLTYPTLGIIWGTILSYLVAFVWVVLLRPLIQKTK